MGPDRVEIPKGDTFDKTLGGQDRIPQEILTHLLGISVGGGRRLARALLGHRDLIRFAIDRGRGGEEHVAALFLRHVQHVQETLEVVLVILDRLRDRLADRLVGREMDHGIDGIVRKQFPDRGFVAEIHPHQRDVRTAGNLLHPLETGGIAIGKIVGYDHVIAGLDQFDGHMAADKTGPAGNQNSFTHIFIKFRLQSVR